MFYYTRLLTAMKAQIMSTGCAMCLPGPLMSLRVFVGCMHVSMWACICVHFRVYSRLCFIRTHVHADHTHKPSKSHRGAAFTAVWTSICPKRPLAPSLDQTPPPDPPHLPHRPSLFQGGAPEASPEAGAADSGFEEPEAQQQQAEARAGDSEDQQPRGKGAGAGKQQRRGKQGQQQQQQGRGSGKGARGGKQQQRQKGAGGGGQGKKGKGEEGGKTLKTLE